MDFQCIMPSVIRFRFKQYFHKMVRYLTLVRDVQKAWTKFKKNNKGQEEIKEVFENKWTVGRVSTVFVVFGVLLAVAVRSICYLI